MWAVLLGCSPQSFAVIVTVKDSNVDVATITARPPSPVAAERRIITERGMAACYAEDEDVRIGADVNIQDLSCLHADPR